VGPTRFVYLNGDFVPQAEARVSVLDRGFLFGDALFETMRAYRGRLFRAGAHADRLAASARALRMALPCTKEGMLRSAHELVRRNELDDAYVRVTLSRGTGGKGLGLDGDFARTLVIVARTLTPYAPHLYSEGMSLVTASIRQNAESPVPRHKTANYLTYLVARQEAADAGADEALLLNTRGEVAEASVANVFAVTGACVVTPPPGAGILPGITRGAVIELCAAHGIPCAERTVTPPELARASEVFLTNSLMEVMPVRSLDGHPLNGACPGPVTARIAALYRGLVGTELGL